MANLATIKTKLASLQDDSLWSIAEMICDLEEQIEAKDDEIEGLEKALAEAEAQL